MDQFVGVFLGALFGAIAGWWLLVRENERLESRRVNNEALAGLGRAMSNYLIMAADANPSDVEFVARRASSIGRDYMGSASGYFDSAERTALSKLESDLADAAREIGSAGSQDDKTAAYDKWAERLNGQHFVLKRAAYELSRPGLRALFRRYE